MPSLAGSFLVAKPILRDPFFTQTVVLLLQHTGEGAFGLVVNREASAEGLPFPVHVGGPCPSEGLLMLHGHEDWLDDEEETEPVAPGIFLGDNSCMSHISNAEDDEKLRYRLFAGYAGWGPDQLERELVSGAWVVVAATGEMLFDTPFEELWDRLSASSIPRPSAN
jgi:putative transcriptional regulator